MVSWTAPSTGPSLGGYEVFYLTAAGSNGSSTTTTTELTLTGLMLGQTYSIFVVAFGPEGAPVLPSAHSNTESITLSMFKLVMNVACVGALNTSLAIQPTGVTLIPATFIEVTMSVVVSWTAPHFVTPETYSVSFICLRLCDNALLISFTQVVPNGLTSHYFTSIILNPGHTCTVRVTAVLSSISSESDEVTTKTIIEGL